MADKKRASANRKKTSKSGASKKTSKAAPAKKPARKVFAKAARPVAPKAKVSLKLLKKEAKPAPVAEDKPIPKSKLPAAVIKEYKQLLNRLRDRVVDEISFLAGDNLNRSQRESSGDLSSYSFHMADQGTDNFDREFALNLVSSEQDVLYEIDDALRRIDQGVYGMCETCGCAIEKARLSALPFAKMCIKCKSQAEKGKTRFRPFGPTISQTVEPQT